MNEYLEFLDLQKTHDDQLQRGSSVNKKDTGHCTSISLLKTRLALLPDFDSSDVPDDLLVSSLYARDNNIDAALELVCQAHVWRPNCLSSKIDNEIILSAVESCLPSVLERRDQSDRPIVVVYAYQWDPEVISFDGVHNALTLTLDLLLKEKKNQESGVVVVTDWTDFSFRQCMKIPAAGLKSLIHHFHRAYPIKFHAVHFVNQPWYLSGVLAILRQFIGSEEKLNTYLHGNNMSTLHSHISKECLPAELGGERPSHNPRPWYETMKSYLQKMSSHLPEEE